MLNMDLLKNPGNWVVILSMALVGATAINMVTTHIRRSQAATTGAN